MVWDPVSESQTERTSSDETRPECGGTRLVVKIEMSSASTHQNLQWLRTCRLTAVRCSHPRRRPPTPSCHPNVRREFMIHKVIGMNDETAPAILCPRPNSAAPDPPRASCPRRISFSAQRSSCPSSSTHRHCRCVSVSRGARGWWTHSTSTPYSRWVG